MIEAVGGVCFDAIDGKKQTDLLALTGFTVGFCGAMWWRVFWCDR